MPWCAGCDRFYNPNTLEADGSCPSGHVVAVADGDGEGAGDPTSEKLRRFSDEPTPWHFKVLITLTALYLAFRLVQIAWWGIEAL